MKTILLILFLACFGAWAQTPPTDSNTSEEAAKDAALRRALHDALAADNNTPTNVATLPPLATTTNIPASVLVAAPAAIPAAATSPFPAIPTNPRARRPGQGLNPAAFGGNNAPVSALPTIAAASAPVPPEQMIPAGTIDFPQVSIDQVLPIYGELVGRTILHAQLPQVMISLKTQTALTKAEAIQALDSVLAMNGITMVNVGDKFVKAVQGNQIFQTASPFTTHDASELPEADLYITHIAQLKYAKPSELVAALTPFAQIQGGILPIDSSQILIIRDYAGNVKRMLELIKQIDVTVQLDYDQAVIPIKYAQASDIASALSSISGGGGGGTTIGHGGTTGGSRSGGTTGGLGTGSGVGTGTLGGGINPGGTTQPGGFGSGSSMGGARTSSFSDRLNSIVKNAASQGEFHVLGQTKIIADQRTNSLLVFASKQDMEMIKKIVGELDIVLAQVLIEAIIMEVSLNDSRNVGVSYLQNNPTTAGNYFQGIGGLNNGTFLNPGSFSNVGSNASSSLPSGLSYFAQFGNDFQATATAIANDGRITVLSRPRIQTSHGVAASLQVGDTVPEVTGTYFSGIGTTGSSSQYQQVFVGINLQVTPLINPDGLVVMDILQDVQQLGTPTTIDGNSVPTTSKRTAQATVSVRDRDTIILGGMISTTKSTTHSGVPFLMDIPGLGYLFRSSSDSKQRTELIVLIRPTVLPTPEAAALVAAHERAKLPGVKASERELQLDENKRMEEADKIKVPKERD